MKAYCNLFFVFIFLQNSSLAFAAQAIGPGHKDTYESAAEDAGESKNAGYTVMGIHSAASAVCASACATGEVSANVCMGASISAGAGEGIVNKDMQSAFSSSMTTLAPQIYGSLNAGGTAAATTAAETATTETATATETTKKKGDKASCFSAAMHAMQAASNAFGAQQSSDQANDLQEMAQEVTNTDSSNHVLGLSQNAEESPTNTQTTTSGRATDTGGTVSGLKNKACTEARTGGQLNAVMNCALKVSPALTRMMSDPKFHEEFQKVSGQDLGTFIKSIPDGAARSPSSVLGAAYGGSGSLGKAENFQKTFSSLDQIIAQAHSKGTYSQFGKRKSTHQKPKAEKESDASDFMKNMLSQMGLDPNQQGKNAEKQGSLQAQRELAQEEKNTGYYLSSRSLFDQISQRYQKSSPKLWNLPWNTKENQKLNHSTQ